MNCSTPESALRVAIDRLGGQAAMARLIGLTQPAIFIMLKKGRPLPAEHVLKVEAATGVSRHDLRPDIYPRDLPPAPETLPGAARPHDPPAAPPEPVRQERAA